MTSLVLSILLHAALGVALAALVWAVGLGWLDGALAYAAGLLTTVLAALLVLVSPWLAVLALPLVLWPLVRGRACAARAARDAAPLLGWALPGVLGLPVALGLLLHGPTAELDSNAYGDMLFYVAKVVSAEQSVAPFRDLLVEGEPSAYVEAGSTFLGAVLSWLPGFDPFLFQTTTLPALALASIPIGLTLLDPPASTSRWLPAAGLLAVTAVAYPTWLTESPPVALALPLAFTVYAIAVTPLPLGRLALVSALVAVDYALTKGFGVVVLGVAVLTAFLRDHARRADRRTLVLLGAATLALGAAGLAFFLGTSGWLTERFGVRFLPGDALAGLADQVGRRDTQAAGLGFELLGLLALLAALVRARAGPFVAILAVALAGHWLVSGHSFDVLVGSSILLAAIHFRRLPGVLAAQGPLVLAAGALLAVSAWFRDISAVRAGLVFVVLLALALVGAFAGRQVAAFWPAGAAAVLVAASGRTLVAFVLLLVVAAAAYAPRLRRPVAAVALAAAVAVAAVSDLALTTYDPTLTTDHFAVWDAAAEAVPADGLVFTSLTGTEISGDQGWNYYPGVIGRQVYLAGWSNSVLLVDEEERDRRLRLNAEVLSGARRPGEVPLERDYGPAYAVVRVGAAPPASWRRLYANERFELYRIPA